MHSLLRIGTRGSQLALWQARTVAARLESAGVDVELVIIKTSGDRLQSAPITDVGNKRLFVKEIEDALLDDTIDVAVHSAKDMPALLPDGLTIAATLPREDPRDAFVLPPAAQGDVAAGLAAAGPRAEHRHEQRQAHRPAVAGLSRRRASRRFAATSTRGCASSMRENTTRWCSPPPACAGLASATASRR